MSLILPITGVDQNYRTPGAFAEILYNQGAASAAAGVREVVFAMPMLSTGTWTSATLYRINSTKDAEDGAGVGSPLHRAVRKFLSVNKDAKCWGLPVAETTGGSPIAATSTITIATTATGTGTVTATICGEDCSYTFASAATATQIGSGLQDAINAKTHLPVTALNSSGTVTLTAKLKGVSQGTTLLAVIRVRVAITSGVGTTATSSGSVGSVLQGVEGSTTEATNLTTALNALAVVRKYYIVSSANDSTSLGNLKTHIATKSEPRRGLRSVGICGFTGSLSQAQTIAIARNYERLQMAWQKNSEHDSAEIAGAIAAIRQKYEGVDTAYNFNNFPLNDILLPAYSTSDWPTGDDQNDAINDGIAPIASLDSGAQLIMSVNTRSKNPAGTVDDFRSTETHRVSVSDEFVDEELAEYALNYSNKKLKDDQLAPDGKFDPNQRLASGVITPKTFAPHIGARMDKFNDLGKLQNVAATKASVRCVKTGSRIETSFDLNVIDWLNQVTYRVAEISQG